jgi:hypothetical protein
MNKAIIFSKMCISINFQRQKANDFVHNRVIVNTTILVSGLHLNQWATVTHNP